MCSTESQEVSNSEHVLTTGRLILRPLSWEDLEDIHALHCDPLVDRYNTLGIPMHINITEEVIRPIIENQQQKPQGRFGWTIRLKSDNSFIGEAGLFTQNDRFQRAEIHYHIIPPQWRKGYGTEAAKALIRFGLEGLNLHRVEAGVATENIGSWRVLEKAGMTREGLRRKILPIRGEWHDNYLYAILDSDFKS